MTEGPQVRASLASLLVLEQDKFILAKYLFKPEDLSEITERLLNQIKQK